MGPRRRARALAACCSGHGARARPVEPRAADGILRHHRARFSPAGLRAANLARAWLAGSSVVAEGLARGRRSLAWWTSLACGQSVTGARSRPAGPRVWEAGTERERRGQVGRGGPGKVALWP